MLHTQRITSSSLLLLLLPDDLPSVYQQHIVVISPVILANFSAKHHSNCNKILFAATHFSFGPYETYKKSAAIKLVEMGAKPFIYIDKCK